MAHIEQNKDVSVTQDNQIIESCYTMKLNEKRALCLAISKINPETFPDSTMPLKVSINTKDWAKYFPDEKPWRALKQATVNLLGRHVVLHPKTGIEERINWFSSGKYHENEGYLTLTFTREMQVRLMGMLEQFTSVNLLAVSKLRSLYSIRLYELLNQFRSTGYRVITMEDFRFSMDCVKTYKATRELNKFVLKPAIKDINAKSNLKITVANIKKGRKITGFKFYFKEDNQADLF